MWDMTEKILAYIDRQIKMYRESEVENDNEVTITMREVHKIMNDARIHELEMLKKRIEKGLILTDGRYL